MFTNLYYIILEYQKNLIEDGKMAFGVSCEAITFSARWANGLRYDQRISIPEYINIEISDEVLILTFIRTANQELLKKMEKEFGAR